MSLHLWSLSWPPYIKYNLTPPKTGREREMQLSILSSFHSSYFYLTYYIFLFVYCFSFPHRLQSPWEQRFCIVFCSVLSAWKLLLAICRYAVYICGVNECRLERLPGSKYTGCGSWCLENKFGEWKGENPNGNFHEIFLCIILSLFQTFNRTSITC